jgi:hypothetical protein
MTKAKQIEATATAEAQKVYMGAKFAAELPDEFVMARREYLKENRNELRQANALSFLTAQNGFMFWFYKAIGARESATFYIADHAAKIAKSDFLNGYKQAVALMQEVGADAVCDVSFTKAGNVAVKAKAGIIAVQVD